MAKFSISSIPAALMLAFLCISCIETKHEIKADVAPIEVKPIHITADININIKVDKALDDFFGDMD